MINILRALFIAILFFVICIYAVFPAEAYAETIILHYDGISRTYTAPPISLNINGQTLNGLPMPPIIIDDRTLVPARETFEALGAVVTWQAATSEIYIGYNGKLVILQINNLVANIDGELLLMDVHPRIINDKTMIPLRFASEALGLDVNWDITRRIASVSNRPAAIPVAAALTGPPAGTQHTTSSDMPRDISKTKIPERSYPETEITGITIPKDGLSVFTVTAAGPISKVDTFPLDGNRIVLDFYNAEMTTSRTLWPVGSAIVERIRMAQNQTEPQKITRIVFDLNIAATYSVSISSDRTEVFIIFEDNKVTNVRFDNDNTGDYVDITLRNAAAVNVHHLTNTDRVVIDVPFATITDTFTQPVNGRFVSTVRAEQFDPYTVRITLEVNQKVQHTISTNGPSVIVRLSEPTFRNIIYNEDTKTITISKGASSFLASDITHYDLYNFNRYVLTLPVDLSSVIGYGEYIVHDNYLRSIVIQTNSYGFTELTLNKRRTLVAKVTEEGTNIYIKLLRPQEVYGKIVVIDPGHGGRYSGASHFGLREKDLNLSVSQKVMALIEQDGRIKAYSTRNTDIHVDLIDRSTFGNDVGDLFISIHHNASKNNPNAHGTEAFYFNRDLGSDINISSRRAAEILHEQLVKRLDSHPRRVAHKNLSVTRESRVPAVLLEIGFMSNEEEAKKLATESYQWLAAQAIFDGIIEIFEIYTPRRF